MYKKIISVILFLAILMLTSFLFAQELTPLEVLGKQLFFEKISDPDRMSCATCHAPEVGFVGPVPGVNLTTAVYRGAVPQRFGNRKPPSASYATISPIFNYDPDEDLFYGGNFWDGRATGWQLGSPSAEQALGPFLNPVEQNNASKQAVLMQIEEAKMGELWETVWGKPIAYDDESYNLIGLAIAAYEGSQEVNPYSSKFDFYWPDLQEGFTNLEYQGWLVFSDEGEGGGKCTLCHMPPDFTDFTFDNLGIPPNPDNPFYDMDQVFLNDGSPINPKGDSWIDNGLGDFLRVLAATEDWRNYTHVSANIAAMSDEDLSAKAADNDGKHKVPSLRNVDKRPSDKFIKAYGHNGYFKSLEEIVHFYNTRDVIAEGWPAPEVSTNVNTDELGNLGLSLDQEAALVAFMKTLSDGYDPVKDKVKLKSVISKASLTISGANPFNPTTHFTFYLPEDGEIQIFVYNTLGQKVAILVDGFHSAGEYKIDFNAAHLASGIYLARYQTKKSVLTKKVTLIK